MRLYIASVLLVLTTALASAGQLSLMGAGYPGGAPPPSPGVIFAANPALNGDDANDSSSFRVRSVLSSASTGTVTVTLTPGTVGSWTIGHASICKWDGVTTPSTAIYNCTTAPLELKFSGASGFSGVTSSITSDALVHSGSFSLGVGDTAIVIYDNTTGSTATSSQRFNNAATNARTGYISGGAQTWNQQTVAGVTLDLTATNYCIATITAQ